MTRYGKRYFWFAAGILINAFGVAAVTRAELGTPPIAGVAYVFSQKFPLTMGQVTFLFNGMLILLQVALLRRKFPPVQLLQMLVNILFSACLDLAMAALDWLRPAGLPARFAVLLAGCVVLALGIAIEVAPGVLTAPGEGAVRALAQVTGRRFGSVKAAFDLTVVGVTLTASLVMFGQVRGIGVGTAVSALAVGRIINLLNARLLLLLRHILGLAEED